MKRWHKPYPPQPGVRHLDLGHDEHDREIYLSIRPCPESLFLNFLIEDERNPGYVLERVAKYPAGGRSREVITWQQTMVGIKARAQEWLDAQTD